MRMREGELPWASNIGDHVIELGEIIAYGPGPETHTCHWKRIGGHFGINFKAEQARISEQGSIISFIRQIPCREPLVEHAFTQAPIHTHGTRTDSTRLCRTVDTSPVRRRVSIIQFREEVHSRIEGQDMQLGLFHPASINATSWIVEWLSKAWHVVTLVGSTRRSFTALKATPGPLICCVLILD